MTEAPLQTTGPNHEKTVGMKTALLLIVGVLLGLIVLGTLVGKAFFWDKYQPVTKAERDLRIALEQVKQKPGDANARVVLGWSYFKTGKPEQAVREYENAIKIDPKNMQAQFNLASVYLELGKLDEAQKLMEGYVAKNPLHAAGHSIMGMIYSEQKKYELAIKEFEASDRVMPGNTNIYYQMGRAYEGMGNKEKAREMYQKTIDYNPKFEEARTALKQLDTKKETGK
ncbi:MAG: tetratricopeptide repeat protein [Bacillota bacterium]